MPINSQQLEAKKGNYFSLLQIATSQLTAEDFVVLKTKLDAHSKTPGRFGEQGAAIIYEFLKARSEAVDAP